MNSFDIKHAILITFASLWPKPYKSDLKVDSSVCFMA